MANTGAATVRSFNNAKPGRFSSHNTASAQRGPGVARPTAVIDSAATRPLPRRVAAMASGVASSRLSVAASAAMVTDQNSSR